MRPVLLRPARSRVARIDDETRERFKLQQLIIRPFPPKDRRKLQKIMRSWRFLRVTFGNPCRLERLLHSQVAKEERMVILVTLQKENSGSQRVLRPFSPVCNGILLRHGRSIAQYTFFK